MSDTAPLATGEPITRMTLELAEEAYRIIDKQPGRGAHKKSKPCRCVAEAAKEAYGKRRYWSFLYGVGLIYGFDGKSAALVENYSDNPDYLLGLADGAAIAAALLPTDKPP